MTFVRACINPAAAAIVHTAMTLPTFSISRAGIQGQWLTFALEIEALTAMCLQDSAVQLNELGRQALPPEIVVEPGASFSTEMRFLLPPVVTQFPHFEANALHQHAARVDKVLWLIEQAEHHGKVTFRLGESWHEVPIIACV